MQPDKPGQYRLQAPDGRVRRVKVFAYADRLYVVLGPFWRPVARPIESVEGEWL